MANTLAYYGASLSTEKIFMLQVQWPYLQHFIYFFTYEWAQ
jgi:hypothetical protein